MNRRGFLGTLGTVIGGFMILPGAGRIWKATPTIITPYWYQTTRHSICVSQSYIDFLTDRKTKKMMESWMVNYWKSKYA